MSSPWLNGNVIEFHVFNPKCSLLELTILRWGVRMEHGPTTCYFPPVLIHSFLPSRLSRYRPTPAQPNEAVSVLARRSAITHQHASAMRTLSSFCWSTTAAHTEPGDVSCERVSNRRTRRVSNYSYGGRAAQEAGSVYTQRDGNLQLWDLRCMSPPKDGASFSTGSLSPVVNHSLGRWLPVFTRE